MKNILLSSIVVGIFLVGCTEDTKVEEKVVTPKVMTKEEETQKNVALIKEKSNEILESSKEIAKAVTTETKKLTEEVVKKAEVVSVEVAKEAKEITNNVAKEITKNMDKVIEKEEPSVDVIALYAKCAACHGQNGQTQALGKSQIIKGWSEQKVKDALNGYKNGTYGGNMKGVMIAQVVNLSDNEIDALAKHIASFK